MLTTVVELSVCLSSVCLFVYIRLPSIHSSTQVILKTAMLAKTGKPFFIVPQVYSAGLTPVVMGVHDLSHLVLAACRPSEEGSSGREHLPRL